MNTFLIKHKTIYGYDKLVVFIEDKIQEFIKKQLDILGFEHIYDNNKIVKKEVLKNNINGYAINKSDFDYKYNLYFKIENEQKSKERLLEILAHFKRAFEKLGIYLEEFINSDENVISLLTYKDKVYVPFKGIISSNFVNIKISNLLNIITYSLPYDFYKNSFCFYIQNKNRTEIVKKEKELIKLNGEELHDLDDYKSHLLPVLVIVSISLMDRNQYRLVLGNDLDNILVINSNNLEQYLVQIKEKYTRKKYIENMSKSIEHFSNKLVLCKKCISNYKGKIAYKNLTQNELNNTCSICKKNLGLNYILK